MLRHWGLRSLLPSQVLGHTDNERIIVRTRRHHLFEGVSRYLRSLQEALVSRSREDVVTYASRGAGANFVGDACQPGQVADDETARTRFEIKTFRFAHVSISIDECLTVVAKAFLK